MFYYISLFFAVFALSTSAIFVKLADAPPITAFYRLFFAMLVLLPFYWHRRACGRSLQVFRKNNGDLAFYQAYFCPVIMCYGLNH